MRPSPARRGVTSASRKSRSGSSPTEGPDRSTHCSTQPPSAPPSRDLPRLAGTGPRLPHPTGRGRAGGTGAGRGVPRCAHPHLPLRPGRHLSRILPVRHPHPAPRSARNPPQTPSPRPATPRPGVLATPGRCRGGHLLLERLGARGPCKRTQDRLLPRAGRYLVTSRAVRARVADLYGIDADVVPPPVDVAAGGDAEPVAGIAPGFVLCVSRLLPYKNVEAVTQAFRRLPDQRLVVVGSGPLAQQIAASAPTNVTVLGRVDDAGLRWLYRSSIGLVAASYEDFGLTPVEAAGFGRPTAALRWGGFLDTVVEGSTGLFFDQPEPRLIAEAVDRLAASAISRGSGWSKNRPVDPSTTVSRKPPHRSAAVGLPKPAASTGVSPKSS